jgi:hypothetical protein
MFPQKRSTISRQLLPTEEINEHLFEILDPNNPNIMLVRMIEISQDETPKLKVHDRPPLVLHVKTVVTYQDIHGITYERTFTHYLDSLFISDKAELPLHLAPNTSSERVVGRAII